MCVEKEFNCNSNITDKLNALYKDWIKAVRDEQSFFLGIDSPHSNPLLLGVPQNWGEKSIRIMFVGEELHNYWYKKNAEVEVNFENANNDEESIKKLQLINLAYTNKQIYKTDAPSLDEKSLEIEYNTSPFWNYIRAIVNRKDEGIGDDNCAVVWNNLDKFNCIREKGQQFLTKSQHNALHSIKVDGESLLSKEMEITNPTHIVFMLNNSYLKNGLYKELGDFDLEQLTMKIQTFCYKNVPCFISYHPAKKKQEDVKRAIKDVVEGVLQN